MWLQHVHIQLSFFDKRPGAQGAFERLLPAVHSDVPLEFPRRQERFATNDAVMRGPFLR